MTQKILFRHVGVVVEDLDKTLNFYLELFPFKVERKMNEGGKYLEKLLGIQDVNLISAKLSDSSGKIFLEFLEFINPKMNTSRFQKINDLGPTHFAITVEDIELIYQKLKSKNLEIISTPNLSEDKLAKVFFFKDINNCLVEVVQVLS